MSHASQTQWTSAASEDRTHDLRIMRPTRYQLRYSSMPDGVSLRCICTAAVEVGNARTVATRNALWRQRAGRRSGAATAFVKAAVAMGTLEEDEMRWLAQENGAAAKVCKSNVPRLDGGPTWKHICRCDQKAEEAIKMRR